MIYKALSEFQSKVPNIDLNAEVQVTTKTGGKYTFRYATLGQIMETIRKPLAESKLSVSQRVEDGYMVTQITHEDGSSILSKVPFIASFQTAQELGSIITYSRRYGLVLALGLVAEDDNDGSEASGNHTVKKEIRPEWKKLGQTKDGSPVVSGQYQGRTWYARLDENGERVYYKTKEDLLNDMDLPTTKPLPPEFA
jgi:hypothetical protein